MVRRFEVWLVSLDPTVGSEISKARPCIVVSPDAMNRYLSTAIVCPMTTTQRRWPTRVEFTFQGRAGEIAIDQIRTVDKKRLVRRLGAAPPDVSSTLAERLVETFAP